jgi:Fe-S cluster biosynthesis and repair protein YggX
MCYEYESTATGHKSFGTFDYSIVFDSLSITRLSSTWSLCSSTSTRFWKAKFFIPPSRNCFEITPYFCFISHWIVLKVKMVQIRTIDHELLEFTDKSGWRQLWTKSIVWKTLLINERRFIVALSTSTRRSLCSTLVHDFLVENVSSQKPRTREGILYNHIYKKATQN